MVITEGAVGSLEAAEGCLSWPFVLGDDMVLGAERQRNNMIIVILGITGL
jgi:hypothetical protein